MQDPHSLKPKIVLVQLASHYVHSALAPWCLKVGLSAYAKTAYTVVVAEGTVNEEAAAVKERLVAQAPDILGFSCYIWNILFIQQLLPLVKKALPHTVIVLGGPEAGHRAEELLRTHEEVDYVLAGEGEKPFALLVDALAEKADIAALPGLCYREGETVCVQPPYQHEEMQPSPYDEAYFAQLNNRIAYLETSRGCPFSCAFCLSGRKERVRFVPLERAKEEMVRLANSGATTIKLVDRTFNCHAQRARAIFAFLMDSYGKTIPKDVCFHFEIAGDLLDDETLALLQTAPPGLFQMEAGLQSLHRQTLDAVRRKTDVPYLLDRLKRLIAPGNIHVHIDLIAGLPLEDLPTFIRGFNQAFLLYPHQLQLGFLKVIPGSAMRQESAVYPMTYDMKPPYQVHHTPWLSLKDMQELVVTERALELLYNRGRFAGTLRWVVAQAGDTPYPLVHKLGQAIVNAQRERNTPSLPLDVLTEVVYAALCSLYPGIVAEIADQMLLDRLATTATAFIPPCLRVRHPAFKEAKERLRALYPLPVGLRRAVGILRAGEEPSLAWADYTKPHPVTGRYAVQKAPLSAFILD